jgi:hypothetical protein
MQAKNINRICITPVALTRFCFNTSYQFIPLLNLRPQVIGLTPFGCLHSISDGNIIFDLRLFYLRLLFRERNEGLKQGRGVSFLTENCP